MSVHEDAPDPSGWSGPRPLLPPDPLIAMLTAELRRVIDGRGRVVFLVGDDGVGKSRALETFQAHLHHQQIDRLRVGFSDCADADCWREISRIFTRRHRLRGSLLRLLPEWLGVIPVLGQGLKAVVNTIRALRDGGVEDNRRASAKAAAASAMREVRSLLDVDPLEPRVILLDSLDRASPDELIGAFALIKRIAETRTLFVLAAQTSHGAPDASVRELVLEAERQGRVRTLTVEPLDRSAVAELVRAATGNDAPVAWLDWLIAGSDGLPVALWQRLGEAERSGGLRRAGRGWLWYGEPPAIGQSAAATGRLPELSPGDRRILSIAALEGRVFHSAALAAAGALDELHVENRLAALHRAGLVEIRPLTGEDAALTSRFAFRSEPLRRALAQSLDPAERARLEDALATAMHELALPTTE